MRCACCHRKINPANAYIAHDGRMYGQVCAKRLCFVAAAPKRKPGNFAIFGPRTPVRVDDGQVDLFAVAIPGTRLSES